MQILGRISYQQDQNRMLQCINIAEQCLQEGSEVPIVAAVWWEDQLLAQASNTTISTRDPTAHAEINAIRYACKKVDNHRLPGSTLYVTLEPCMMCFAAIMEARIARIVYAAADRKFGMLSKRTYQAYHTQGNHHFAWTGGVEAVRASVLLRQFFRQFCR